MSPENIVTACAAWLVRRGMRPGRVNFSLLTLHPALCGVSLVWRRPGCSGAAAGANAAGAAQNRGHLRPVDPDRAPEAADHLLSDFYRRTSLRVRDTSERAESQSENGESGTAGRSLPAPGAPGVPPAGATGLDDVDPIILAAVALEKAVDAAQAAHVERWERPWGFLEAAEHQCSPVHWVMSQRQLLRVRLAGPGADPDAGGFALLQAFRDEGGAVDYLGLPVPTSRGDVHVFSMWTDRPGGWTEDEISAVIQGLPAISVVVEMMEWRRLSAVVVSTYLGARTGPRVLAGQISRGATERIRAAVWFADLRSFSSLTEQHGERTMVVALDDWFEMAVNAVHRHGGEARGVRGTLGWAESGERFVRCVVVVAV